MIGRKFEDSCVSVIIPTYDRQIQTLSAIESVLAQGSIVAEVIVVDDASAVPFELAGRAAQDERVRIVRHETNKGAAAARNAGWRAARHSWVAFLDSDDLWLPGKLAEQLKLVDENDQRLIALSCAWSGFQPGVAPVTRTPVPGRDVVDFLSGCWFCPGSTLLIRRAAFERLGPFDERLRRLEDFDWFVRFGREGGELRVSDRIGALITYGRRARLGPVRNAARLIEENHLTGSKPVPSEYRRRLKAYLALECAAAARNEQRLALASAYVARSLLIAPRIRLHLKQFWEEIPEDSSRR